MPSLESVLAELEKAGNAQTRKVYRSHGAAENAVFGVRVADLKRIAKTIKGEQALAHALFETGNVDAMYLAGLIADGRQMSRSNLDRWVRGGKVMPMISEYTVPWVAAESPHAHTMALKWLKSKQEHVAASGWCTYSRIVATDPDDTLDLDEIEGLLGKVAYDIHKAPNRARYTMNNFVISVGAYVAPLLENAKAVSKRIGDVSVDRGGTACKVPLALASIEKIEGLGRVGKKRKTIRC